MIQKPAPNAPKHQQAQHTANSPRRLSTVSLFDGAREVIIEHSGRDYRLRITQNGKLILNA